ncbi:MAG: ABC transporter ATP-binding protein [Methylocystaceae bacterium]
MLNLDNISLTMDGLPVLDHINLEVKDNECAVILGPSGCGKSSLLNLVAGLILPDQGQVWLNGADVTGITGQTSYMQQKHLLLPWRTLMDNCTLPLTLKGVPPKEANRRAAELMGVFGLSGFEDYYPSALSGGMGQRAALLRTYLCDRPLMLLDEPFASLDAITRRRMQEWLGEIREQYRLSVLFVTHDIDEAIYLGNHIYLLSGLPARVLRTYDVPSEGAARAVLKNEIWSGLKDSQLC